MSFTQTPNYSLYKPTINADNDQWGTHLNANADTLDTTIKSVSNAVPLASSTTPAMDGTAAIGTGTTWARSDHVHPTDTTRAPSTGVTNASNAAAGQIGEYLTASLPIGTPITLTNAVAANVVSLALTAGDWDVWGGVNITPSTGVGSALVCGIGTTSATLPTGQAQGYAQASTPAANIGATVFNPGPLRFNVSVPTTIYLVVYAGFASGTTTAYGALSARRMR